MRSTYPRDLRLPEVRPTSRFSLKVAVGRTSSDRLARGTRPPSGIITRFSAAALGACLLAVGLLLPAAVSYAEPPATPVGTVNGSVTCGPDESVPAAHAMIAVEGTNLNTRADTVGKFTLTGLPAAQFLTIDAVADPQGSAVTSRYGVVVQPGDRLDIGNLDLLVCPPAAAPEAAAVLDEPSNSDFRDQP